MVAKKKYDECFRDKDDCELEHDSSNVHSRPMSLQLHAGNERGNSNGGNLDKSENINEIWESNSGRMVFNFKDKTLNLGNMQATSYKHNKMVYLPSPESPGKEIAHEFRKREMN